MTQPISLSAEDIERTVQHFESTKNLTNKVLTTSSVNEVDQHLKEIETSTGGLRMLKRYLKEQSHALIQKVRAVENMEEDLKDHKSQCKRLRQTLRDTIYQNRL